MVDKPLSEHDLARYARHITLPGFGGANQRKLLGSSVLVVGAGGLGSPVLLYLVAAGVGHITVIDDDVVEESNLQRQVIHRQEDIGRYKAESARDALARLDPAIAVDALVERLTPDNALDLFSRHNVVVDGTDNFATRYLCSDAAELTRTAVVWASISRFQGQLSVFDPGRGPMLRDLYPEIPDPDSVPSCAEGGVLGALVGLVGSMMAVETIKMLTGIGEPAIGRLLLIDALDLSVRSVYFNPDPDREPVTDLREVSWACKATASACSQPETATAFAEGSGKDFADQSAHTQNYTDCSAYEVAQALDEEASATGTPCIKLIDVRSLEERNTARIMPSVHIPLEEITTYGWKRLADEEDLHLGDGDQLVFYCRSGARSRRAITALREDTDSAYYPQRVILRNLQGGILGWQEGPGLQRKPHN